MDIQKLVNLLQSINSQTISISQLSLYLDPLLNEYKNTIPYFPEGVYLYRGRLCKKPITLNELSYPPSSLVRNYGRVNNIGESIFYGATARNVPFFELNCQIGDMVALSTWKTVDGMKLNHIGFTEECKRRLFSNRNLDRIYSFSKKRFTFNPTIDFIRNYLAMEFSQSIPSGEEYRYKTSIAIAQRLLAPSEINGLMYPAIAMNGNADNVALKPAFVDNACKFISVELLIVTGISKKGYSFKIIDSATKINSDGSIIWNGRELRWKTHPNKELFFKAEGGTWAAYECNGQRVDPD